MNIDLWPVVGREQLIQAFRPGEPDSLEAPFRTLRKHGWATAGVSVQTRKRAHAAGRTSLFSALNVVAARTARTGQSTKAKALARSAARLESGRAFTRVRELLTGKTPREVELAMGAVTDASWPELLDALRRLAQETRSLSATRRTRGVQVLAGRISESLEDRLVLEAPSGTQTLVPRWLAHSARRETVGDLLALVTDQLDDAQMIVRAVPAIDLDARPSSPFGRAAPVTKSSARDVRLLARRPAPLRVVVPVTIT